MVTIKSPAANQETCFGQQKHSGKERYMFDNSLVICRRTSLAVERQRSLHADSMVRTEAASASGSTCLLLDIVVVVVVVIEDR